MLTVTSTLDRFFFHDTFLLFVQSPVSSARTPVTFPLMPGTLTRTHAVPYPSAPSQERSTRGSLPQLYVWTSHWAKCWPSQTNSSSQATAFTPAFTSLTAA